MSGKPIRIINAGDVIPTQTGEIKILTYHTSNQIYCEEYEVGEDEELHLVGSPILTSNEIAERYHEYCGRWIKFIYQEEEEEE